MSSTPTTPSFRKSTIIKGAFWFAFITILSMAVIFFYNNTGQTIQAIGKIQLPYICICLLMLGTDLVLGGWRNHIFVRKINPNIPFITSFRANTANMFMGAITPGHGGAGPAQIYIYMRGGLDFLSAFTISLINMAATLVFMPLAAWAAIGLLDAEWQTGIVPSLLRYGFLFFLLFLIVFVLAFIRPRWIAWLAQKMAIRLSNLFPGKKDKWQRRANNAGNKITQYQRSCSLLISRHPWLFPYSVAITIILYFNKYCMQWIILNGLGISANLGQVIAIQVLIQFMIYFMPSPGGSGFAEAGIAVLFRSLIPPAMMPLFTLLQRSFLLFIPALIGAVVVIRQMKKELQKK